MVSKTLATMVVAYLITTTPVNAPLPDDSSFKAYEDYKCLTCCEQYDLQQEAWTDDLGFRRVDDRYCVALGSRFGSDIGTHYTVVLENGTEIKCILADQKADKDTDENNVADHNGCVVEFVVDTKHLQSTARTMGDASYACDAFEGNIKEIIKEE